MNFEKIFGWMLLIVGIVIIGWSLFVSYNIFTGKSVVPEIFKIESNQKNLAPVAKENLAGIGDIQSQIGKMISEQLGGMLPTGAIPKIFNLSVWAILATILIFGGGQISNLGIKLLK